MLQNSQRLSSLLERSCHRQQRRRQPSLVHHATLSSIPLFTHYYLVVRTLIDFFGSIPGSEATQKQVLEDNVTWARQEKRIFLKQSLETRLVALQLETQSYRQALSLIDTLLLELKRLDDKLILTEVHLLESRVYRGIGNFSKSKVRLEASCGSPDMDLVSGSTYLRQDCR